jgi:hypothetical protein
MAKIANHLRTFAIAVLTLLASTGFALDTETPDVGQLRDKLKKAQDAGDKPAIIELAGVLSRSRRTTPRRGTRSRRLAEQKTSVETMSN